MTLINIIVSLKHHCILVKWKYAVCRNPENRFRTDAVEKVNNIVEKYLESPSPLEKKLLGMFLTLVLQGK